MTETKTIPAAEARELFEELAWTSDGEEWQGWTRVTCEHGEARRWQQPRTLVVRDGEGALWGLQYEHALTEMQDHSYPWEFSDTVTLVRLFAHEIRRVEYRTEPTA